MTPPLLTVLAVITVCRPLILIAAAYSGRSTPMTGPSSNTAPRRPSGGTRTPLSLSSAT